MVPEQWIEQYKAPSKSISFEQNKLQPELFKVQPAGVVGSPLDPNLKVEPLIISGGGPIVDYVAPSMLDFFQYPKEVSTYGGVQPVYNLDYEWHPMSFDTNIYVEFSFGYPVYIRGLSTTGRPGFMEWVSSYKIMYLHPYLNQWIWLHDEDVMDDLRIKGNFDDASPMDHIYSPSIFTSRIRIYVLKWNLKPAMWIRLFMGTTLREDPQIVAGPTYEGNFIKWTWEALNAGEGETQEIHFSRALTLTQFMLGDGSTISTFQLEYLSGEDQWTQIENGETVIFSNGETVDLGGVSTKGFRIDVLSWQGDNTFFGNFHLKIVESVSALDKTEAVLDIRELANHYLKFRWEDSQLDAGSSVIFSLSELKEVTRIETKGCNGAWISQYALECRTHYGNTVSPQTFAGNANAADLVEHVLNLQCKYVIFRPSQYEDGICAEVYIYSSAELLGSTAKVISPGRRGGSFNGQWSLIDHGAKPYLEFIFNHHLTPTKVTFEAIEPNDVHSFEIHQRSGDDESDPFEDVGVFSFGSSSFDGSIGVKALRILPKFDDVFSHISFSYLVEFVSDRSVQVTDVNKVSGIGDQSAIPKSVSSGNYVSSDTSSGQYIRFEFKDPVTIEKFTMDPILGSIITDFELLCKAQKVDDFETISVEGETTFSGSGDSVNVGSIECAEFKVLINSSEGDKGVKFDYKLFLSGSVGQPQVRNAFQDAQARRPA